MKKLKRKKTKQVRMDGVIHQDLKEIAVRQEIFMKEIVDMLALEYIYADRDIRKGGE